MKKFLIFNCPKDDDWIVCVKVSPDIMMGVADCPDEETAETVLEAMRIRDEKVYPRKKKRKKKKKHIGFDNEG